MTGTTAQPQGSSEATRHDPAHWYRDQAIVLAQEGRFAESEACCLEALRIRPDDLDMLNNGKRREPDSAASRRWGGDVAAFAEVIYSLLGAL